MNHGGKRDGSGRKHLDPKIKRIPVGVRLPQWLDTWIKSQDASAGRLIEEAVIEKHGLEGPHE